MTHSALPRRPSIADRLPRREAGSPSRDKRCTASSVASKWPVRLVESLAFAATHLRSSAHRRHQQQVGLATEGAVEPSAALGFSRLK